MNKEKSFVTLIATAAISVLIDLAFVIFFVCQLASNFKGSAFFYSGFWWISLIVIIFNTVELLIVGAYLAFRKN